MKKVNFLVIGVPKAGTTTLHHHFSKKETIRMSLVKEAHFFDDDIDLNLYPLYLNHLKDFYRGKDLKFSPTQYRNDEDLYHMLFNFNDEDLIYGEVTPYYLYSNIAMKKIYNYNKDMKLIIVLRNPVERAWSHYLMDIRLGKVKSTFKKKIEKDLEELREKEVSTESYLFLGLYFKHIENYIKLFGKENIHIIVQNNLKDHFTDEMKKTFKFLNINYEEVKNKQMNTSKVPKNLFLHNLLLKIEIKKILSIILPKKIYLSLKEFYYSKKIENIDSYDKLILEKFFLDDVNKLSKLLNINLLKLWFKKDV